MGLRPDWIQPIANRNLPARVRWLVLLGVALGIQSPAMAQSSDNVNDVFDPSASQTEIVGDNGLNINGLMDLSRKLNQAEPWGLREESVDDEVTRFRNSRDGSLGPEIFGEDPDVSPSTTVELGESDSGVAP